MRSIYTILLSCFFICGAYAQKNELSTQLSTKKGAERIQTLRAVYNQKYYLIDSSITLPALREVYNLGVNEKDEKLELTALILAGDFCKEHYHSVEALAYLNKAIAIALRGKYVKEEAEIYIGLSWIYYQDKKFPLAFEYNVKANNVIEKQIGYQNFAFSARYLNDLGYFYYDFGNIDKARQCLLRALTFAYDNPVYKVRTLNTLALCYRQQISYDSAAFYFNKAIAAAEIIHDSAWIGIINGNLGSVYYYQKNYAKALPLLQKDYVLSMKEGQWISAGTALATLAEVDIANNNFAQAKEKMERIPGLLKKQPDEKMALSYATIMSTIYENEQKFKEGFYMKDSALKLQAVVFKRNDAIKFSQVEKKIAIEEHLAEMKLLESEKKRSDLLRNAIILVGLLFLIIAAQLIIRQKILNKKNQELLRQADNQLNIYIESIKEKNLMINEFRYEVEELNNNSATVFALKEKEEIADKLKKYTILTEVQWDEFRHLFEKVHTGFFDKIRKNYPSLTQSEIRILALLRLNLSRKEMAEMLGISPDSITKTRQRMRKKIDLPDDMDLDELVVSI